MQFMQFVTPWSCDEMEPDSYLPGKVGGISDSSFVGKLMLNGKIHGGWHAITKPGGQDAGGGNKWLSIYTRNGKGSQYWRVAPVWILGSLAVATKMNADGMKMTCWLNYSFK